MRGLPAVRQVVLAQDASAHTWCCMHGTWKDCVIVFKPGLPGELQLMQLRQSSSIFRCQLYMAILIDEVAAQKRLKNPVFVLLLDNCFCREMTV